MFVCLRVLCVVLRVRHALPCTFVRVLRCMVCMRAPCCLSLRCRLGFCPTRLGGLPLWLYHRTNGIQGCLLVVVVLLLCRRGLMFSWACRVVLLCVECNVLPPSAAPPQGGLPSLCVWTCLGACPPHFVLVALAAGCLTPMDGHHRIYDV
jgi:hypothetical protein